MHLAFPQTAQYTLHCCKTPRYDDEIISWFMWAPVGATAAPDSYLSKPRVTIFVQPPWLLTKQDLTSFIRCSSVSAFMPLVDASPKDVVEFPDARLRVKKPLKERHRLWAKIYDVCEDNNSLWFVVTSYWGWVFGAFSQGKFETPRLLGIGSHHRIGRTHAWTSDIIYWDSKDPTIVECLMFWFASATAPEDLPGAWTIPQVSGEATSAFARPSTFRTLCLNAEAKFQFDFFDALASNLY